MKLSNNIILSFQEFSNRFGSRISPEYKMSIIHELLSHQSFNILLFLLNFQLLNFTLRRKQFRLFFFNLYFFFLIQIYLYLFFYVSLHIEIKDIIVHQTSDLIDSFFTYFINIFGKADVIFIIKCRLNMLLDSNDIST